MPDFVPTHRLTEEANLKMLAAGVKKANELGCKYAGDPVRPIRGIMPNNGGLPDQSQFKPTCSMKGMAGFWINTPGDTTVPFTNNIFAMNRALTVNGCTPSGVTYATASVPGTEFQSPRPTRCESPG